MMEVSRNIDFEVNCVLQSVKSLLAKNQIVEMNNLYDLRYFGPERYMDYLLKSAEYEIMLNNILSVTLPKIWT